MRFRSVTVVLLLSCLPFVTSIAAAAPSCAGDPQSGTPVPDTIPGVCLTPTGQGLRLVQVTSDGVLILVLPPDPHLQAIALREGPRALELRDRAALVVYCPNDRGDERSDGIAPSCLSDFEHLETGTSALLGVASILDGILTPGGEGSTSPASLRVAGILRNSTGEPFELRSTLSLRDRGFETGEPSASCAAALQSLTIRSLRPGEARPSREAEAAEAELDAGNPGGFEGYEQELLDRVLALGDTASPGAGTGSRPGDGTQSQLPQPPVLPQTCLLADPFTNECLSDKIDAVQSSINGVDNAVTKVNGTVNRLEADLVDRRPEVRDLVDLADATQVAGLFNQVNDEVQGLLDTAAALQAGFDTWRGQPCDSTSQTECGQFKRDLLTLISDMESVQEFVKSTSCLDVPFVENRGLEPGMLRDLLDKTPPIALIALRNIVERIAPSSADPAFSSGITNWSTMFGDLLASIPQSMRDDISAACGEDPLVESGGDPIACTILRPPAVEKAIKGAQIIGKVVDRLAKTEDEVYTVDDFELTLEAMVGAGGGAGGQVPNVLKATLSVQSSVADNVGDDKDKSVFEKLMELRDKCLDRDKDIEEDLRECTPRMSYFLSYRPDGIPNVVPFTRPTFQEAVDQMDRHVEQTAQCRLAGGCKGARLSAAQSDLSHARKRADTRKGFNYLCDAYCELTQGTGCHRATSKP